MKKVVNTRVSARVTKKSAAKLPHERDESVGMTGGVPSEQIKQAYRDVDRGLSNTDQGLEADSSKNITSK